MSLTDELNFDDVIVQKMEDDVFSTSGLKLDVLRLDRLHEVVSGNKWFKLKYYLQEAVEQKQTAIATFGGAFSNHIIAAAYACNKFNLPCTGFIRGEEPKLYSQTLMDAVALNMQLRFVSREAYKNKQVIMEENPSLYFIPEGGFGKTGAKGAAEILALVPQLSIYNYIICAVGTGTMLAGIANASLPHQQCIGVSVMKNNFSLESAVFSLTESSSHNSITILHDYAFGGYAKYTNELFDFMQHCKTNLQLQLDFVYTAKAFYAVHALAGKGYFASGSNILFVHSGGLQGNRSLPV